jgi:hypothetical protein
MVSRGGLCSIDVSFPQARGNRSIGYHRLLPPGSGEATAMMIRSDQYVFGRSGRAKIVTEGVLRRRGLALIIECYQR